MNVPMRSPENVARALILRRLAPCGAGFHVESIARLARTRFLAQVTDPNDTVILYAEVDTAADRVVRVW